ncbi:MAG: helix-turn-helix domain-containing protein [Ilumatobacteraceae bacterium]
MSVATTDIDRGPQLMELYRVLSVNDAAAMLGVSRPTFYRMLKLWRGLGAPSPVKLTPKKNGYVVRDLIAWCDLMKDASRQPPKQESSYGHPSGPDRGSAGTGRGKGRHARRTGAGHQAPDKQEETRP